MEQHGPDVWVIRRGAGYSLKYAGMYQPLLLPVSQRFAIEIGRLIAKEYRSELVIQSEQGQIRERDSHGFDSPRRRG